MIFNDIQLNLYEKLILIFHQIQIKIIKNYQIAYVSKINLGDNIFMFKVINPKNFFTPRSTFPHSLMNTPAQFHFQINITLVFELTLNV